jgi:methyl-accepting chemotaxis protein
MGGLLRSSSVAQRLNLLNVLFGLGLVVLGGLGLTLQWRSMVADRVQELTAVTQLALAGLEHERAQASAMHIDDEESKRRALATISALHYGTDDYVFALDMDGVTLAHPVAAAIGKNPSKAGDSNGFMYFPDVKPRAMRDGTASVRYTYPHLGQTTPVTKLAVFLYYAPWQLFIAAGVYMDTMEGAFWSSAQQLALASFCVLVIMIGLGLVVSRSIVRPLRSLQGAMHRLAGGERDVPLPEAALGGEIGAMARAVVVFKDAGIAKDRLETDMAAATQAADVERERLSAVQAAAAEQQQAVVQHLASGLGSLASGDLTFRLERAFAPEYETLRSDYNGAMGQMQETMTTIVANTAGLRSGAGEITHAADDLARRTEQQAASLEETAAALDEITATVRKTAEGANQARDAVTTARTDAEASGRVVRDAMDAMGEIEKSAEEISKIVGVIDEIAFQTNLLALNAGVEAARAGDSGRGFAVVASEVRSLAQRSAEAAKEIKALIATSNRQVGHGVKLVDETGQSLARIVTQVMQISGVVAEIAHSAQEQATGLHEVNKAINQMDQMTQQNAAMVEQSTAASHALEQETDELARLTSRFRLDKGSKAAAPAGARQRH